jgi:hypothetical protein
MNAHLHTAIAKVEKENVSTYVNIGEQLHIDLPNRVLAVK